MGNYTASHSPKIIIICGADNTGKDSLINGLKHYFNKTKVIHAGVPKSNDLFNYYYNGFIHDTLEGYYNESLDAVIHNRSMYGEYVYGPKYRNESRDNVLNIIKKLEIGQLKTFICEKDLFFILLTSSNINLIANNDDGLSLSSNKSDIEEEIKLFDEIFNLSTIKNKLKVYVNNNDVFKPKEDICKEVIDFINSRS